MQLLILVLNRIECLDGILEQLLAHGIGGATVLESTGMMRVLDAEEASLPMFGVLRQLFDPEVKSSKTVFVVLRDEQVSEAMQIINSVTGGLNRPDTGIAFSVPTLFVEGLESYK